MDDIEVDYYNLKSHHVFRKHPQGLKLYREFRRILEKPEDEHYEFFVALAKKLGTSVQTLYNRRRRELANKKKMVVDQKIKENKLDKPAKKQLVNIGQVISVAQKVHESIPAEIDTTRPLETQVLARIHQGTLLKICDILDEILEGDYKKWVGGSEGQLIKLRKKDDPRFLAAYARLVDVQRKLIEDRMTMFGMLKEIDGIELAKELERRFRQVIERLSEKDPRLMIEFVRIMEGET